MSSTSIIRSAVETAVSQAAASPRIDIQDQAVEPVTDRVVASVAPIVEHLTNQEPWIQSRVMLGSIAAIVSSGFAIVALIQAGSTDGELYAPPIVAILGGAFAIYGRIIARKPLGA